ncbi:protein of unknown function [Methylocella tundrae]|uniref:Uncharacterized protein n=1 Tax=Methylocella tundrae TaxID=227605 RepID=A0A4U8Z4X6_METTU|nr:protein of unknown function [Methylocella tundrae]
MRLHLRDQVADCAIPAAEEGGVFFPEGLQAPVGADQRANGRRRDRLSMNGLAKERQAVLLRQHRGAPAEVNPGQKLQKAGWRVLAARHEHRNHRKPVIAHLPHQSELTLILLGVANPVGTDEDGDSIGLSNRVFERRDPAKTRAKLTAVKEGTEALGAQPAVQLRRGGSVAAGIAQENIVAALTRHPAALSGQADVEPQRTRQSNV